MWPRLQNILARFLETACLGDTAHIILPRKKEALRRSVNQAIAKIRADGTGHRIMRRHLPVTLD